ncbi:MAG: hypothetical protein COB93_04670 [Sneathiella sp.]|nr:MAG: hypothetical protein COB93_04670 [Sneathiella sp.]
MTFNGCCNHSSKANEIHENFGQIMGNCDDFLHWENKPKLRIFRLDKSQMLAFRSLGPLLLSSTTPFLSSIKVAEYGG